MEWEDEIDVTEKEKQFFKMWKVKFEYQELEIDVTEKEKHFF